ncbi:unnamed protein product [Peniophora sp. CBMAI 1063]|nr:unnamed protein product [Peniophora sp. CBMAI 1063]
MGTYCGACDQAFLTEQDYGLHKRDSENHEYCWHCDQEFDSPVMLEEHLVQSSRHAFCQYCKQQFQHRQSLEAHWEGCHFWCAGHRKFHPNEGELARHFKEHPDHPYCEACGKCCSETDIYEHYDSRQHPECTECDRLFATDALLKAHMTVDHNHCPQCNLFFQSCPRLDAHLSSRRHQPALVTCPGDDCGQVFVKASELRQHFDSRMCSVFIV